MMTHPEICPVPVVRCSRSLRLRKLLRQPPKDDPNRLRRLYKRPTIIALEMPTRTDRNLNEPERSGLCQVAK